MWWSAWFCYHQENGRLYNCIHSLCHEKIGTGIINYKFKSIYWKRQFSEHGHQECLAYITCHDDKELIKK